MLVYCLHQLISSVCEWVFWWVCLCVSVCERVWVRVSLHAVSYCESSSSTDVGFLLPVIWAWLPAHRPGLGRGWGHQSVGWPNHMLRKKKKLCERTNPRAHNITQLRADQDFHLSIIPDRLFFNPPKMTTIIQLPVRTTTAEEFPLFVNVCFICLFHLHPPELCIWTLFFQSLTQSQAK